MSPSPGDAHQRAVANLHLLLGAFVKAHKLGRVYTAPFDVYLPSGDIVEPDLLFISQANLGIIQRWVRGAPDLVIEVLSFPDGVERDRIVKRDLYAKNGIREYWIVDPDAGAIEVLTLRGEKFEPAGYFEVGDTLDSSLFAEFRLKIVDVFID